jgi:hypothetical protein
MSDCLEQRLRLAADVELRKERAWKARHAVTLIRSGDTLLRMLMGAYPKGAWGSSGAVLRSARNSPARAPSANRRSTERVTRIRSGMATSPSTAMAS